MRSWTVKLSKSTLVHSLIFGALCHLGGSANGQVPGPAATIQPYAEATPAYSECPDPTISQRLKCWLQYTHWGYPQYFKPAPLGGALQNALNAQKLAGLSDQCMLYQMDFYPAGYPNANQLTPFGIRRLEKIVHRVRLLNLPISLERSNGNLALDEARRQTLATHPLLVEISYPAEQIQMIINPSGVNAIEAMDHYQNMISSGSSGLPLLSPGPPAIGTTSSQSSTGISSSTSSNQ